MGGLAGHGQAGQADAHDAELLRRVSDRDVAGYLQLMRETVAGNWRVRHVRSYAEKRASRAERLDELGMTQRTEWPAWRDGCAGLAAI